MVEDLLLLSRVESREHREPPGAVDLAELLDILAQRLRPAARQRGQRLVLALPEPGSPRATPRSSSASSGT